MQVEWGGVRAQHSTRSIDSWSEVLNQSTTVGAVKDQLNIPPPHNSTPQNLLNIGQLHCHMTRNRISRSRSSTKLQNSLV